MTSAVQVIHPPGYAAERAYAARMLLGEFLGLEVEVAEAPVAEWELRCDGRTVTVPDVLFRTQEQDWLTTASLPSSGTLYGDDLFGNAFFLLTRYEEAVMPDRDEHGRFPAEAALAVREGLIERPLVNEYAEALWEKLQGIAPRLERRKRSFRTVPSHDVDHPRVPSPFRFAARELRQGRPAGLRVLLGSDPYDTFDLLMDASERRGLRTAFYFIADEDAYSLDDPSIRALLRRIHGRGHELGFHASYRAFSDPERTRSEFERLVRVCGEEGIDQEAWGGRQHFLRWEPATWRAWDDAGLDYDSSLTYSARPGFRAGSCYDYPVFDLIGRRQLRLRERPLVLMDAPTLDRLGLPDEGLERLIDDLRDRCERFGGDFTVLWHNSWLVTRRQRRLFEYALGQAGD